MSQLAVRSLTVSDKPTKQKSICLPCQLNNGEFATQMTDVTVNARPLPQIISQVTVEQYSNMIDQPVKQQLPNRILEKVLRKMTECPIAKEKCGGGGRWMAYQLEKHVLVLVGPTIMQINEGAEISLFCPDTYAMKLESMTGKLAIFVQRKLNGEGELIMGYCYFVYEPSQLAFPTLICDWINCFRRNTLKGYFSGGSQNNDSLVYGNVGHSMLEGLGTGAYTHMTFEDIISDLHHKYLHEMYLLSNDYEAFEQKCVRKFRSLFDWFSVHVKGKKELEIIPKKLYCTIERVTGCEVRIRSRLFGFKGVIDMLLDCTMRRGNTITRTLVPLELKTGDTQRSQHSMQVHIYNLMLSEKFDAEAVGLLYYPSVNRLVPLVTGPMKVHEILIRRNEIIKNNKQLYSQNNEILLPRFDTFGDDCKDRCEYYKQCIAGWVARKPYLASMLRDIEDLECAEDIPNLQIDRLKNTLAKLDSKDKEYMSRWIQMLHLQEKAHKHDVTKVSQRRLNIFNITNFEEFCGGLQLNVEQIRLLLSTEPNLSMEEYVLLESTFRRCEKVLCHIRMIRLSERVEIESTCHDAKKRQIKLTLKFRNKRVDFNEQMIGLVARLDCSAELQKIDYNTFGQLRSTIVNLTFSDKVRNKIRRVVMNEKDDSFGLNQQQHLEFYNKHIQNCDNLNEDQRQAIRKALTMDLFSLIEGMPGTGKTKVIVGLIEILANLGLKVLVSSYTNNSLDCILDRVLSETNIGESKIIREGTRNGSYNQLYYNRETFTSADDIDSYFKSKKVWFVTLSSLQLEHVPSDFNVVIIDEASQCLEPLCISALEKAKKFVLIGDYQQLQPLVRSQEAAEKGMAVSLFERMCKKYSELKTPLKKQYRMCEEIMALSNSLVYNNLLEAADEKTKTMRLKINEETFICLSEQLKRIINPQQPIVFINHDSFNRGDISLEDVELTLTSCLYRHLISLDVGSASIISFYNNTTYLLKQRLKRSGALIGMEGAILTVDKSQGIDKDCIIFLVQDGPDQSKLIKDMRRINVSLTRSKCKLIIIGSKSHTEKILGGKLVSMLESYRIQLDNRVWKQVTCP